MPAAGLGGEERGGVRKRRGQEGWLLLTAAERGRPLLHMRRPDGADGALEWCAVGGTMAAVSVLNRRRRCVGGVRFVGTAHSKR